LTLPERDTNEHGEKISHLAGDQSDERIERDGTDRGSAQQSNADVACCRDEHKNDKGNNTEVQSSEEASSPKNCANNHPSNLG